MKKFLPFILAIEVVATIVFGILSYSPNMQCVPGWSLIQSTGISAGSCPNIQVSAFIGTYLDLFYFFGSLLALTLIIIWAKHSLQKEHHKTDERSTATKLRD